MHEAVIGLKNLICTAGCSTHDYAIHFGKGTCPMNLQLLHADMAGIAKPSLDDYDKIKV